LKLDAPPNMPNMFDTELMSQLEIAELKLEAKVNM
jgi:hypothetical protein